MTICDVCNSNQNVKRIRIAIDTPSIKDNKDMKFDFCDKCMDFINNDMILIGIRQQTKSIMTDCIAHKGN